MLDQIFQNVMAQSSSWMSAILSIAVLRQVAAFAIILVIAWLLQFLLYRLLHTLASRSAQISWTRPTFAVMAQALLPVVALSLGQLVMALFRSWHWTDALLVVWLVPLLGFWLVYRLIGALLNLNMSPGPARLWTTKVILPLLWLIWLFNGFGVLDDVLQWGPALGGTQRITIGSVITGLVVIVIFLGLARGIRQFLERTFLPQATTEPALAHAVSTLITYAVVTLGVITALSMTGFDLTTLTVIVGGLSVGLGFGLQQIVNNFVSGFILMLDRSIGPGDIIEVEEMRGVVQSIGIRSMIVKTADNFELIIPNSRFLTETVINLTRTDPRVRVRISINITRTANPREVEQALLAAAQHPYVLDEPPPGVQFQGSANGSLNFDLLIWTSEPAQIPRLSSDVRYSIWDNLAARNIQIGWPQPDVHIHLPKSNELSPEN